MTISEILVATAIAVGLVAAMFGVADPLQGMFDGQLELVEMHQRLRSGAHVIARDLLMAASPVMPYRVGSRRSDPASGTFYRDDTVTLITRGADGLPATSDTFYLRRDDAARTSQLMHYDGDATDAPVVDHVVALAFAYFDAAGNEFDPAELQDGPWSPADGVIGAFDVDLLRIRRVRVTLRVQASRAALRGPAGALFTYGGTAASMARYLPDREVRIDVAPRNLERD